MFHVSQTKPRFKWRNVLNVCYLCQKFCDCKMFLSKIYHRKQCMNNLCMSAPFSVIVCRKTRNSIFVSSLWKDVAKFITASFNRKTFAIHANVINQFCWRSNKDLFSIVISSKFESWLNHFLPSTEHSTDHFQCLNIQINVKIGVFSFNLFDNFRCVKSVHLFRFQWFHF